MAAPRQRSPSRSRLSRKELKAPDEFLTLTGRALNLAGQHWRMIVLVLGLVIAGIVLVWGALAYRRSLEQGAWAALSQIEARLRATGDGREVPAALVDQLQQLTQQWGAGEARGYAWLHLGHLHYRQGDYSAAAMAYQQAQTVAKPARLLWPLATLGLGYALEASGEWHRAQEAYQRLIDTQQAGFLVEAYLGKGRAAEHNNDFDSAIAAYSTVVERYPAYAQMFGIADKIEALQARRD
jgi:tetratricopeptide (TPR) repeat protein